MNLARSSARLDAVLHQFQAISTAEEPYNYSPCGPSLGGGGKMNFPSLYLSRSTDKGLMKMQGEGTAMVNYKIRSRSIDENTEDGVPLYGASIEIRSIEPIAGEVEEESELSETLFLREFAVPARSVTKLMKTSKLNPLAIRKTGMGGEFRVAPKGAAVKGPKGYFTDDIKDARGTAADLLKRKRAGQEVGFSSPLYLRSFGVARDRDGEGRYSAGNVPGADDYAIAGAVAPKKKSLLGAGVAGLAGGAAAYGALRTKTGQNLTERAAKGILQLKGKFSK